MSFQESVERLASKIITHLKGRNYNAAFIDGVFQAALKQCREDRYYHRGPSLNEQNWEPVLRDGYGQYEVSDWGYVRHKVRGTILRPAPGHDYARAAMFPGKRASGKAGGHQHMIHELVFESFRLHQTIASFNNKERIEIINHLDEDKWNPHVDNLEPTSLEGNMVYYHMKRQEKSLSHRG